VCRLLRPVAPDSRGIDPVGPDYSLSSADGCVGNKSRIAAVNLIDNLSLHDSTVG
jgi:hypothetical protein